MQRARQPRGRGQVLEDREFPDSCLILPHGKRGDETSRFDPGSGPAFCRRDTTFAENRQLKAASAAQPSAALPALRRVLAAANGMKCCEQRVSGPKGNGPTWLSACKHSLRHHLPQRGGLASHET